VKFGDQVQHCELCLCPFVAPRPRVFCKDCARLRRMYSFIKNHRRNPSEREIARVQAIVDQSLGTSR
jgi:hypothetical protein